MYVLCPPLLFSRPVMSQYRVSALSKVGADQLTFPDQDNGGQDEVVAKYFGQKYFKLRVRSSREQARFIDAFCCRNTAALRRSRTFCLL